MGQFTVQEDNQQERLDSDVKWLAGIIDSEGSIISSPQALLRVVITNCNLALVQETERILQRLGVQSCRYRWSKGSAKYKDRYSIDIRTYENCFRLLTRVSAFLVTKLERVALAISIARERLQDKWHLPLSNQVLEWSLDIQNLNHRGVQNPQRLYAERIDVPKIQSDLRGDTQSAGEIPTPPLEWMGGFIDGDGCISVSVLQTRQGERWKPFISLSNTHPPTIKSIVASLARHRIPFYIESRKQKKPNHKWGYVVLVSGWRRCRTALDRLLPHIRTKNQQALTLGRLIDSRLSKNARAPYSNLEISHRDMIRSLNKKGQ